MNGAAGSLFFWLAGWRMILAHRRLWTLAILPMLLSLLAAGALLWGLFSFLPGWLGGLVGGLGAWASGWVYDVIYYPLLLTSGLVLAAAAFYAVYLLYAIIAAPFYSLMAEQGLRIQGRSAETHLSIWRMARASLMKGVVFLCVGVVLFVCSFIPGLNILAMGGAAMLLAFDFADYGLEARGLGFRARVRYMFAHFGRWVGMGAGLALTLLVPGLTFLAAPGAVVGALLVLRAPEKGQA